MHNNDDQDWDQGLQRISDVVRDYDYLELSPGEAFHDLDGFQQQEMFALLVDKSMALGIFNEVRYSSTSEFDEICCYIESIMTRLGWYYDGRVEAEEEANDRLGEDRAG